MMRLNVITQRPIRYKKIFQVIKKAGFAENLRIPAFFVRPAGERSDESRQDT